MGRVLRQRGGCARLGLLGVVAIVLLAGCGQAPAPPRVHLSGEGLPAPKTAPATAGHETVLLVGDSLLWQSARAVRRDLRAHAMDAKVVNASVVGKGLLTPGLEPNPIEYLRQHLDRIRPTIVVFEFSGNYDPSPTRPLGSPAFYDGWMSVATQLTDLAQSSGASVYWVIPPPRFPSAPETDALSERFRAFVLEYPGVRAVDWWAPFVDRETNTYANYLELGDQTVRVRNGSIIHFTKAGATRAARWLVDAIRAEWDLP